MNPVIFFNCNLYIAVSKYQNWIMEGHFKRYLKLWYNVSKSQLLCNFLWLMWKGLSSSPPSLLYVSWVLEQGISIVVFFLQRIKYLHNLCSTNLEENVRIFKIMFHQFYVLHFLGHIILCSEGGRHLSLFGIATHECHLQPFFQ